MSVEISKFGEYPKLEYAPAGTMAENSKLRAENERLRESLAEIREIWAGAEVGKPVHAQEAYAIRLCEQMYKAAVEALAESNK